MINKPAPFILRLLALITEKSYELLLTMIFVLIIVSQPNLASAVSAFFVYLILYFFNPLIVYNSIILTHYFGGSLGKLFTGLQVVNEKIEPLPLKRIAFRQTIGYSFSWLVFGLGFASIAKDAQKQGWHDKTVGSLVVVKQNLWPIALAVCIISIAGSVYLGMLSWNNITTGPLNREAQVLLKEMNAANRDITPTPTATPTN